jgi:hypothetical protein
MKSKTGTCECSRPKPKAARCCSTCRDLDEQRTERATMRRRIMAALTYQEHPILAFDLRVAMEMGEYEAMSMSVELGRLVAAGEVESQRIKGGVVYRIAERRAA